MLAIFFLVFVTVGLSLGSGLFQIVPVFPPGEAADLGLSWTELNDLLGPEVRVFTDCYTQPAFWDIVESQLARKVFVTIKPTRNNCAQLVARRGCGKYIGATFAKHDRAFLVAAILWENCGDLVVIDKREPVVSQTVATLHNV